MLEGSTAWDLLGTVFYTGPETIILKGFHTHSTICTSEEHYKIARDIVLVPFTDNETREQKATQCVPNWLVVGTELNPKCSILKNLIVTAYIGFPLLISECNYCLKV